MMNVPLTAMRALRAGQITRDEYSEIMRGDAHVEDAYERFQQSEADMTRTLMVHGLVENGVR